MKNAKYLRIASVLLIAMAVISVLLILGILNAPQYLSEVKANGETVLKDLAINYAIVAVEIAAGVAGLILAGKKSVVTVILGAACFMIQVWTTHNSDSTGVVSFIANCIFFFPSLLYFSAAFRTFTGHED